MGSLSEGVLDELAELLLLLLQPAEQVPEGHVAVAAAAVVATPAPSCLRRSSRCGLRL